MTSEAHKRNPPGSERWGVKVRLMPVTIPEAADIEADSIGGPKLYYTRKPVNISGKSDYVLAYFCEADELAKWRAGRSPVQA